MTYQERIDAKANEIELLTAYANGVTGAEDSNIGDAIRTLVDGYGQGGGSGWEKTGSFTRTLGQYDTNQIIDIGEDLDPNGIYVFVCWNTYQFDNRAAIGLLSLSQLPGKKYGISCIMYGSSNQTVSINTVQYGTIGSANSTLYIPNAQSFAIPKGTNGGLASGTYEWRVSRIK